MAVDFSKYWRDIIVPIVMHHPPPTIPQAVVLQSQHVLLVKRDNPALWELPGGGMTPDETPEDTVVREVYEETGTTVVIREFLGWYERTGFRPHRSPVYVCTPTGGSLRPQHDETITVRYFPLLALPRGLFPWYRPMLQGDLDSTAPRPLRRTQHVGWRTLVHCLWLDLGSRCGLFD
jgi:8-oxo-dGTP pyrophosphatase MutT (NUDIX family)